LRLIDYNTFSDLVADASVKSLTYARLQDYEAVDQMEEIVGKGDHVLVLKRMGTLAEDVAEELLRVLKSCYEEPLERRDQLDEVEAMVRKWSQ